MVCRMVMTIVIVIVIGMGVGVEVVGCRGSRSCETGSLPASECLSPIEIQRVCECCYVDVDMLDVLAECIDRMCQQGVLTEQVNSICMTTGCGICGS